MVTVVKIGGNIVDNEEALGRFVGDFAALGGPKILVHGGGVMASFLQRSLGMEPCMVDGRRVTDEGTLRVVAMVYAGGVNKDVVARLQAAGCDALGLSGADGDSLRAVRRAPEPVDFGYVGDVTPAGVNTRLLRSLIDAGVTPVFCAITHDGHGQLLNTNADTVASVVARAFAATDRVRLLYCFEKRGVLADPDDDNSATELLTRTDYEAMKASGTARAGMLAKLDNAFEALAGGVAEVVVMHAADLSDPARGTRLEL